CVQIARDREKLQALNYEVNPSPSSRRACLSRMPRWRRVLQLRLGPAWCRGRMARPWGKHGGPWQLAPYGASLLDDNPRNSPAPKLRAIHLRLWPQDWVSRLPKRRRSDDGRTPGTSTSSARPGDAAKESGQASRSCIDRCIWIERGLLEWLAVRS